MCFIGLSLGSRYVRGGAAVNIGLSVIIGYSYYGFSTILKSLASSGTMPIYLAWFLTITNLYGCRNKTVYECRILKLSTFLLENKKNL